MLLIFLDAEMSGLNPERHRLLEIAYVIVDAATGRRVHSYSAILRQPKEVWERSDPESLKVNGFTWEKVLTGITEKTCASEIINDFTSVGLTEKTGAFICQNPSQDRIFFNQLISVDLQEELGWPYHWLDLASMYWAVRHIEDKKEARQIKEGGLSKNKIAAHYGVPPEAMPHTALGGVNHLLACYEALFGSIGGDGSISCTPPGTTHSSDV